MVSSPEPCASSGGRLPEAFFLFSDWNPKVQKHVNLVDLVKSFTQSIYYLDILAKFGFDTAENESFKVC